MARTFGIDGGGGVLLYLDGGAVTHSNLGISYQDSMGYGFGLSLWSVSSSLSEFSADIDGVNYSLSFPLCGVRPKVTAGFINLPDITVRQARSRMEIDGLDAFYAGASAGVGVGRNIEVTPSFFFARAQSRDGSWYYFYGRPNIPALWRIGLFAEYDKTHRAGFTYDRLDFEIVNDSGFTLVRSDDNYAVGGSYAYAFPFLPPAFGLDASVGVNYAYIDIDGSLTRENQQYWGFPYMFYNLTGKCDAVFGWTAATFVYSGKRLAHKLSGAAVQFFSGELYIGAHVKYRPRIFHNHGDAEFEEDAAQADMSVTRGGIAAYSLESLRPFEIKIGGADKVYVSFEARKILGYSWRMDDVVEFEELPEEGEKGRSTFASMAKTILLSGLSANLKVEF